MKHHLLDGVFCYYCGVNKLAAHNQAVKDVQKQVTDFFVHKKQARIFHGGTNSTRSRKVDPSRSIDISHLRGIIEINTDKRYILVEPNVSMERLVDATLALGLIPPIISEFPAITVGGAIQGGAGESSSFKYGCLHETSLEYEVVLGDGSKVVVSPTKDADLFYGIACSCGSLGILTMVKLSLIPATPEIKLTYHRISSSKEAVKLIDTQAKKTKGPDFIDGIMFSKTSGVIMLGYFTTETQLPKVSFHKFSDEWFYLHAQKVSGREPVYEELMPTRDYLFRYDRGAFWMGREGAIIHHIPFNRLTRLLFAPVNTTEKLYRLLHGSRLGQQFLIQDNLLPKENVAPFVDFIDKNYGIYPLWLCPMKSSKSYILSPANLDTELVIDVGVWGAMREEYETFVRRNRQLEDRVDKLRGRKMFYAHCYYSEPEFWSIYDNNKYQELRRKYVAEVVFPDIYTKTYVSDKYKPSFARGWWKLLTKS